MARKRAPGAYLGPPKDTREEANSTEDWIRSMLRGADEPEEVDPTAVFVKLIRLPDVSIWSIDHQPYGWVRVLRDLAWGEVRYDLGNLHRQLGVSQMTIQGHFKEALGGETLAEVIDARQDDFAAKLAPVQQSGLNFGGAFVGELDRQWFELYLRVPADELRAFVASIRLERSLDEGESEEN